MQKKPREIRKHSHIPGACRVLGQGDYKHRRYQVANIVHQELAIKFGLSKGPPMLYYKYEPQSVLENSGCKRYCDRYIMTDRTVHIDDRTQLYESYSESKYRLRIFPPQR